MTHLLQLSYQNFTKGNNFVRNSDRGKVLYIFGHSHHKMVRMQVMCHIRDKNIDMNMVCTNPITYSMQLSYTNFTK